MKTAIVSYSYEKNKECIKIVQDKLAEIEINAIIGPNVDEIVKSCDVIITIGGDGTIIHTAKYAAKYQKPILAINKGRIGFVAGIEISEIDLLKKLKTQNYTKESRSMLEINFEHNGEAKTKLALNDAVVSRKFNTNMLDINVKSSNKNIVQYRADGLILSTATGSTAYSLSAGGPILDPTLKCLTLTPVCPHTLFSRPIVFGEKANLTLTVSKNAHLTVDGQVLCDLTQNDFLNVKLSKTSVELIELKKRDFYSVVVDKLS